MEFDPDDSTATKISISCLGSNTRVKHIAVTVSRSSSMEKGKSKRRRATPRKVSARKKVQLMNVELNLSSDDERVNVAPPAEKSLDYYKSSIEKLAQRIEHFCATGEVLSDDESKLVVACRNKKPDGRKKKTAPAQTCQKQGKTFGKGKVGTPYAAYNSKPCSCCHKKPGDPGTNTNYARPAQPKERSPKKPISYELSNSSDEDIMPESQSSDTVYLDFASDISKRSTIYDIPPQPGTSGIGRIVTDSILNFSEAKSDSEPDLASAGPSGMNIQKQIVYRSSELPKTVSSSEDIDEFVNMLLATNQTSVKGKKYASVRDCLADTQKLLSDTADLIEVEDVSVSAAAQDSVVYVGSPDLLPQRNRPGKALRGEEIIDLSLVCTPPIEVVDLSSFVEEPEKAASAPNDGGGKKKRSLGDCPICLDPLGERAVAATICGHIFCDTCIRSAVKDTKRCPNCRKRLNVKQFHPIFI